MKDSWRGTPYCDRKTAEFYIDPSKCNHPDMHIGQATPCLKCTGSGMKTIAEGLKEHPFNHIESSPIYHYMRLIAHRTVRQTHVFKIFYITKDGAWTETEAEGDWKVLNPNYLNKICDVRHESYYIVNGEHITDYREASEKWLAYQLFAEIVAIPELYFPPNKCTECLYCPEDKLCMLSGKVRKIRSDTVACGQHFTSRELSYAT